MTYLFDTDVIINHIRQKTSLPDTTQHHPGSISVITLAELLYGAKKRQETSVIDEWITSAGILIFPLTKEIIEVFTDIKINLEDKGERLDDFDLLIAATAIVKQATLVTANAKHFKRIPGLKILSL